MHEFFAELEALSPYMNSQMLLVGLFGLGLGIGILTGLFGVGGGFILVPLLNVAFGMEYSIAKGSSLCCFVGTSMSGLARHLRLGNVAVKTMLIISGGAMSGAILGAFLNDWIEHDLCSGNQRQVEMIMHPLYIILLLLVAWTVYRGVEPHPGRRSPLQKLPIGPRIRIRLAGQEGVSLPGLAYLGLGIGVVTGLLGVGGGVLMLPVLLSVVCLDTRHAIGTSLGVVLFASIAGTISYAREGNVSLTAAMCILVGSTLGVQIGAWLCEILHARRIRRYFALLVLATAVMVIADFIQKALRR